MFTELQKNHILAVKNTIKSRIVYIKFSDWARDYILPWDSLYLTGGAIASLLQNEEPKDLDFYCTNFNDMFKMKNHLKTTGREHIKKIDEKYAETFGQDGLMITANAITMEHDFSFITMLTGTPDEVRKTFDYVHCMPYYSLADDKLYISYAQYDVCVNKKLIINNMYSYKRHRQEKFIDRGYK